MSGVRPAPISIPGVEHDHFIAGIHDDRRKGNLHAVSRQVIFLGQLDDVRLVLVFTKDRMRAIELDSPVPDGGYLKLAELEAIMGRM